MRIATIPVVPQYQPVYHTAVREYASNETARTGGWNVPILPSGNHIDILKEQIIDVQPVEKPSETGKPQTADDSLKWLLEHTGDANFTDAVHSQLLKSFLLENGLAVTSHVDETVVENPSTNYIDATSDDVHEVLV